MSTRLGLALGLALAVALATWWLVAARVALVGGFDAAAAARQVLVAIAIARAMLVAVVAPRSAAVGGYVAGLRVSLPIVAVSWPVVALAWSASSSGALRTLAIEASLLSVAVLAPLAGRGLARLMRQGPLLEAAAAAVGVLLACAAYFMLARTGLGS